MRGCSLRKKTEFGFSGIPHKPEKCGFVQQPGCGCNIRKKAFRQHLQNKTQDRKIKLVGKGLEVLPKYYYYNAAQRTERTREIITIKTQETNRFVCSFLPVCPFPVVPLFGSSSTEALQYYFEMLHPRIYTAFIRRQHVPFLSYEDCTAAVFINKQNTVTSIQQRFALRIVPLL